MDDQISAEAAFRSNDWRFPRSFILFLQSAPSSTVLCAFQAECQSRGVLWFSTEAQQYAVMWFVQHPVVLKYSPRRRMVRTFLKTYITSIEEQHVADSASGSSTGEDPVIMELMEEFIRVSVMGDGGDQGLCYKVFYNPYVAESKQGSHAGAFAPHELSEGPPTKLTAMLRMPPQCNLPEYSSSPSEGHAGVSGFSPSHDPTPTLSSAQRRDCQASNVTPKGITASGSSGVIKSEAHTSESCGETTSLSPLHPTSHHRGLGLDSTAAFLLEVTPDSPAILEQFSAIRVSNEQFSNVGMALWPAAFVLVQLLAQELKGQTHILADMLGLPHRTGGALAGSAAPAKDGKGYRSGLRILELGAGVGLTPVFLHHMKEYKHHVASFLATDYQEVLVENMKFNMAQNGITPVEDFLAAERGLEGDQSPPFHRAAHLDWMNHDENEGFLMENEVDVTLAADCIYDTDIIPALVDTIHLALTTRSADSYVPDALRPTVKGETVCGDADPKKQRCCIVVQTHRQSSTMQKFFSAVRAFGRVRSFSLVRQPIVTLRVSHDGTSRDGGCVPLGDWNSQGSLLSSERVVCALVPDVVQEDGSMRRAGAVRHATASNAGPSATEFSHCSSFLTPRRSSVCNAAAMRERVSPLTSIRSNNSSDSRASVSQSTSSATVAETAEGLLSDAMIGPFYTTMAGLIGVHIITLNPEKDVR